MTTSPVSSSTNPQQPITKQQQSKPSNALTYHRWLMGMECRKDILIENEILNKKIIKKVTPFRTRVETQLKNNKMRLAYFVGFCVVFSLDKVYDWVVLENPLLKAANTKIEGVVSQKSDIIRWQYEVKKKIKEAHLSQQKVKQLSEIFMKLDKNMILDTNFMRRISINGGMNGKGEYDKDYVDLASFVNYLKNDSIEDTKNRINGEYPTLNLLP